MKEISHEDKTQLNCSESPPPTKPCTPEINKRHEDLSKTYSDYSDLYFSDSDYNTRSNSIDSAVMSYDSANNCNSETTSRRDSLSSKRRVTFASMNDLHSVHYFEKHPEEVEKRKFRRRVTSLLRSLLKRNSTDM
jgi:hypothetical protein